jgi:WD40 repeat protein
MVEPATAKKQITTELSHRQVTLSAGQATTVFYATVYNDSACFASFQLKLLAAGSLLNTHKSWYRLTPAISTKIPAGDCTRFQIEIFDLPPIAQQFQGAIDLTVEVTSRELDNQYDRQPLRLLAEGLQGQPPDLSLVLPNQEARPQEKVTILAQVQNSTTVPMEVSLRLDGLPDRWFPAGVQQVLSLAAGKSQKVLFECEIPSPEQTLSQSYPLRLEAVGRFPSVTATGSFHILPAGTMQFVCDPLECAIPEVLGRWQNPTQGTAEFALQFRNQSNLTPGVQVSVQALQPKRRWFGAKADPAAAVADPLVLPPGVTLGTLPATLPTGTTTIPLLIQQRLPWLGWTRSKQFQVQATAIDSHIPLQDETQTLEVNLFPVIPLWQQLLGLLLALGLGTLTWLLLRDPGHQAAVNSVQFNGQGSEVLSGSNDQSIRRWKILEQDLHTQNHMGNLTKAVRIARYRPVNNDQVALGLENGEIQLANLLTGERSRLTPDKDDRVFELVFSRDARTLYSGHGSGLVLQWDVRNFQPTQDKPVLAYDTQFAIQAMTLVGNTDEYLAIGGRFNRFLLMQVLSGSNQKPKTTQFFEPPYPSGGSTDYITSLSAASEQPNLLAIADTQGRISLWNSDVCVQNRGNCTAIDKAWLGHEGSPVRAIALSANGCFLASGGDDGRVKLWSLDGQGLRRSSELSGRVLGQTKQPLNAVDVIQTRDSVWVTSGGADKQVRLYRARLSNNLLEGNRCPVLAGGKS